MQNRPDEPDYSRSLRSLSPAQFMALGGNAVVFIRPINGKKLAELMVEPDFGDEEEFQLVVSADGSPLLVADSQDAVTDWLQDKNFGVVSLH